MRLSAALTLAAAVVTSASLAEAHSLLFGVDFSQVESRLWIADPLTGALDLVGPTGFGRLNSMAVDPFGRIYSAETAPFPSPDVPVSLVRLDPIKGAGTAVATIALPVFQVNVRALAFSPSGALFGATFDEGASRLFSMDAISGVGQLIGTTPTRLQALEFSPAGDLYGWDLDLGLVRVDTQTGLISDVNPDVTGPTLQSLAFAPDGRLLGHLSMSLTPGGGHLYEISLDTGEAALIGAAGMNVGLRGMGFAPIPEPSTCAMTAAGLAALSSWGRRGGKRRLTRHCS